MWTKTVSMFEQMRKSGVRILAGSFLGRLGTDGTIQIGKNANLVLLDRDPLADISNTRQVSAVILKGRLIRDADLQELR